MAFNGKWETESQDGYEVFCKLIGKLFLFKQLIFCFVSGGSISGSRRVTTRNGLQFRATLPSTSSQVDLA